MKRISVIALSVIIICLSAISAAAVDYKFDADTVSNAVYLENINAGAVVYEKNSDQRSYPASTTKIMTFIVTAENVADLDNTMVTVKQDVIGGLDPDCRSTSARMSPSEICSTVLCFRLAMTPLFCLPIMSAAVIRDSRRR